MSELTKHLEKQYVKNTDSFRNQKIDCLYEGVIESFAQTTCS